MSCLHLWPLTSFFFKVIRDNGPSGSIGHQGTSIHSGNQPYSGLEPTASGNDQLNSGLEFVDNPFASFDGVDQLWLWNDDLSFWQA